MKVSQVLGRGVTAVALLLCLTVAPFAHAQTGTVLQGTVTDRITGVPISGVSVNYGATTTDGNGNYSLTAAQIGNQTSGNLDLQVGGYYHYQQAFTIAATPTTVNATLLPGGTVFQGSVTDANTQAGIVGATVELYLYGGCARSPTYCAPQYPLSEFYVAATTSSGGQYSIDSSQIYETASTPLAIVNEYVYATAYFTYQQTALNIPVTTPYPAVQNFSMVPASGTVLQGTVTDRITGVPISGVSVNYGATTTDGNGNYSLTAAQIGNQTSGNLDLQVGGYYHYQQAFTIAATPTTVNATLLPGGTVFQGSVTDANTQAGIVGATVELYLYGGCARSPTYCAPQYPLSEFYVAATTSSGGQYSIDSSQIYETASTPLAIVNEYVYATAYFTYQQTALNIPVTTPYPAVQNFSMVPASGTVLQGTVTDRITGVPISGVSVNYGATTTDGNGNYSLTAAQIGNQTSGNLDLQVGGYYHYQQAFTIAATPTTVNATLLPGGTVFQGSVTDANTQAGIVGATVELYLYGGCARSPTYCAPQYPLSEFYVAATTSSGGQYSIDSSQIYETASTPLAIVNEYVYATAYFTYQQTALNIPVTTPYPAVQNFPLLWTGLTQSIAVDTNPTGLNIVVDGVSTVAAQTYNWIPGNEHAIATITPQTPAGGSGPAQFVNWSDGGQLMHIIVVPNSAETLTATFDGATPVITPQLSGTLGNNGWYTSNVSLTWSVVDSVAPVTSTTGCDPVTISVDTAGQTFTCTAVGQGGTANKSVTIKRDATPPTALATPAPVPNANGWNNTNVTVHYSGSDPTSGIASCTPDASITAEGASQSSPPGTCTDNAGNVSAAVTATGISIDKTPPVVSGAASPSPNGAGWNNTAVNVTFTATDTLSGVAAGACGSPFVLSADGAGQSATGTCTDRAGNVASATVSGINIDRTPPVVTATRSPAANANGWNNTSVTVSFAGTDSMTGSGIASCSAPVIVSAQGAGQATAGTCTDRAGNTGSGSASGINIDETPPTATVTVPTNSASYGQGTVVAASYTCSDALSGVASCVGTVPSGAPIDTSTVGSKSFTATATDAAGNTSAAMVTYNVVSTIPTPVITPTVTGTMGQNNWYTSNVSLTWTVTSAARLTSQSGCGSRTITSNTKGIAYTCSATNAGGTARQSVTIMRDASAPTVRATATPAANRNGWRNSAVTVTFTGTDAISGVATCAPPVSLSVEGTAQSASGQCTNNAGLTGTGTASNINIDLTAPAVTITTPVNGGTYALRSAVPASYACSDALSGISRCSGNVPNGSNINTSSRGTKTFTVISTDKAGNTTTTAYTYTVQ